MDFSGLSQGVVSLLLSCILSRRAEPGLISLCREYKTAEAAARLADRITGANRECGVAQMLNAGFPGPFHMRLAVSQDNVTASTTV